MKYYSKLNFKPVTLAVFIIIIIIVLQTTAVNAQQPIEIGIRVDPLIGWFRPNHNAITAKGSHVGFNFGLKVNKYFTDNYAFSAGLSLITASGSLSHQDTVMLALKQPVMALPKSKIVYNIKYLAIPIGIRLKTNEIGFISIFTDIGFDPRFTLGGRLDIPSQHIAKEHANNNLKKFGLGYHVIGGVEYSLGGSTAVVLGLNFDNSFTNIIKHSPAKISHKMFGIHLGLNF